MLCVIAGVAFAAERANFSGSWEFNPEKSKNVGMMSQMRMIQAIEQSEAKMTITKLITTSPGNLRATNYQWAGLLKLSRNGKPVSS
jgi:hypothetical protein